MYLRNELSLNFKTSCSAHWGVDLRATRSSLAVGSGLTRLLFAVMVIIILIVIVTVFDEHPQGKLYRSLSRTQDYFEEGFASCSWEHHQDDCNPKP